MTKRMDFQPELGENQAKEARERERWKEGKENCGEAAWNIREKVAWISRFRH